MVDFAETLNLLLVTHARRVEQAELGPEDEGMDEYTAETTFLDGEEAFKAWSATDFFYGAFLSFPPPPHAYTLAKTWTLTYLPPHLRHGLIPASAPTTSLSTIEHQALLDLLGMPHPLVRSYFPDTT
jgi:glutaminyl-peptide cyclotransferase